MYVQCKIYFPSNSRGAVQFYEIIAILYKDLCTTSHSFSLRSVHDKMNSKLASETSLTYSSF